MDAFFKRSMSVGVLKKTPFVLSNYQTIHLLIDMNVLM